MLLRVQRAEANGTFPAPDCFFVLACSSVRPASLSPCLSIIWIAGDRTISKIDGGFVVADKESGNPPRDTQRSLVILVDAQCQARKPNSLVAVELRIDSEARSNAIEV